MLYSVYEISKSGYGVRVGEKTCVIAQNLRGQVPDIIFWESDASILNFQISSLAFQKTGDSEAYTFLIDSYQGLKQVIKAQAGSQCLEQKDARRKGEYHVLLSLRKRAGSKCLVLWKVRESCSYESVIRRAERILSGFWTSQADPRNPCFGCRRQRRGSDVTALFRGRQQLLRRLPAATDFICRFL